MAGSGFGLGLLASGLGVSGGKRVGFLVAPFSALFLTAFFTYRFVQTVVKWVSSQCGPSADEAVAAIRLAQRELAQAQWVAAPPESQPVDLGVVRNSLNVAWSMLDAGRYEAAIAAAQKVIAASRNARWY